MESDQTYARLSEIARRVETLERTVSAMADSDAARSELASHLNAGGGGLARVVLVIPEGKTQQGIRAAYEARWGAVSVGTIHAKLKELLALTLIEKSSSKGAEGYSYSTTARITHRLIKELERAHR